jgi:hypothetical protein
MTTQPSTVCDDQLFKTGRAVLILSGLASTAIEAQVVRWREELKVPIDWHYVGGRAVVLVLPKDLERVRDHLRWFEVRVSVP